MCGVRHSAAHHVRYHCFQLYMQLRTPRVVFTFHFSRFCTHPALASPLPSAPSPNSRILKPSSSTVVCGLSVTGYLRSTRRPVPCGCLLCMLCAHWGNCHSGWDFRGPRLALCQWCLLRSIPLSFSAFCEGIHCVIRRLSNDFVSVRVRKLPWK